MTSPRLVVTGVVLLTASLLVAGGWWVDGHVDDRRRLAVVRADERAAIREAAALEARGAALQRRLTVVADGLAATSAAAATTELAQGSALADEAELAASGAAVVADLEATFVRLVGELDALDLARRTLDVHGAEVTALGTCLDGIARAADALAVDDGARAVTEMAAVWAPSVLRRGPTWVLYYAVSEVASGDQCISTATAAHPAGPFVDGSSGPFTCQRDQGGSIDPSPFLDLAGEPWLVWKGEGETAGGSATLWSQRLSPDGRQLVGEPSELLHADQRWERQTIEGPSVVAGSGGYHLFHSAGAWSSAGYAVGHARCASPAGPCTKTGDGPLLSSSGAIAGPGGQEVLRDQAGRLHLVFHAWSASDVGYPNKRSLHVADLAFVGDVPVITR